MSPRGRRPAGSDARGDILAAARTVFAEQGYAGASMRAIARAAGVDPALVHHYFAGKGELFATAVVFAGPGKAASVNPVAVVRTILDGPSDLVGNRWVAGFLEIWDRPGGALTFQAMLHGLTGGDQALELIREFVLSEVAEPIARAVSPDRAGLRGQLAAGHLLGVGVLRYVAKVSPVADLDVADLTALVGPAVQHCLTGALPATGGQAKGGQPT